jgi:hypothetical protein
MRKAIISFLFLTYAACCSCQPSDPIIQIAKTYFRSNPYNIRFSTFLNHLVNDPTLSNTTLAKRTDTSFFFFKGDYSAHNPFGFKADRTELRLAETEMEVGDSASTIDTLLLYQVLGYTYGDEGTEAVKKEFSKFDRKYGKNFLQQDAQITKGDQTIGSVRNYFVLATPFSPISIAWARLDDFQSVFTITVRIKVVENAAALPIPPDSR